MISDETGKRYAKLEKAFKADGFTITQKTVTAAGRIGIEARHDTAINYDTGEKKKSYYIEGTPYERGFLMGLLAEPIISDMTINYADNIVFDFIGAEFLYGSPLFHDIIVPLIYELSRSTWNAQPSHVHEEARGMMDGCKKSNPETRVTKQRLAAINVGFDVLCALIYTGKFFEGIAPHLLPGHIRLPMLCNAFSAFKSAAPGEHFFGRDFMFVTGGVLQNNLAHVITLPVQNGEKLYPFVNVTAPGLLGSASVMNLRGVAGGLNMSPAANCDVDNVGFNSLLLLRECVMRGGSAYEAADVIRGAKRGVTWNYVLSDGNSDTACTAEAGASWDNVDFLSYPAKELLPFLPDLKFLSSNVFAPVQYGCAVRQCGDPFPASYLRYNRGLWDYYNARHNRKAPLFRDAMMPGGFINRTLKGKNCPSCLYFAPQRTGKDIHITTNHFIVPHMRLCAMHPWTEEVLSGHTDDIQWRYDQLNNEIRQELYNKGRIDYASAKRIIDFLAPYGKFPKYYKNNPKSRDGEETRIEGCVTLFDLKRLTAESHYGYYCDEWVKTTLPGYFGYKVEDLKMP